MCAVTVSIDLRLSQPLKRVLVTAKAASRCALPRALSNEVLHKTWVICSAAWCARLVSAAAMEASVAPEEIAEAIPAGEVELVRAWLDNGGDANAKCGPTGSFDVSYWSLLQQAASDGEVEIMSLLLSRGADVNCTDAHGRSALYIGINHLYRECLPAIRVLLAHGADVNLARDDEMGWGSPLILAVGEGSKLQLALLRAGADIHYRAPAKNNRTAEEYARYSGRHREADLLRDVRLAGGWVRYALQPHYDLLVLRALLHRGRATLSAQTPEVLVRLFGAPDGRRRTRSTRATAGVRRVHLPDPLFWRVLEFSLGPVYDYPWVRQRVRARAAAVAAAE